MKVLKYILALALVLSAGCASAPPEMTASANVPAATLAAVEPEPSEVRLEEITLDPRNMVTCRDLLRQGSNVIRRTCMTREDWERHKRQEAKEAAAIVRTLQGGSYR
jgi:hypothetical protein